MSPRHKSYRKTHLRSYTKTFHNLPIWIGHSVAIGHNSNWLDYNLHRMAFRIQDRILLIGQPLKSHKTHTPPLAHP